MNFLKEVEVSFFLKLCMKKWIYYGRIIIIKEILSWEGELVVYVFIDVSDVKNFK